MIAGKKIGKLSDAEITEIRALRAKGLSVRSIADRLGRGKSVVASLLATSAAPTTPTTQAAPSAPPPAVATPAPADDAASALDRLGATLRLLDRCSTAALAADDFTRVASLQRTVKDVILAIAKITPPTPPNPNEAPEYVKAAEQIVEKTIGRWRRMHAPPKEGTT
jgi:hypothetical protein